MKELFISYELAKQLKEKGFKEKCLASYYTDSDENILQGDKTDYRKKFNINVSDLEDDYIINGDKDYYISAPLYQQVVDWFRNKHDILISVESTFAAGNKYETKYSFIITGANNRSSSGSDNYINVTTSNHAMCSRIGGNHSKHITLPYFATTDYYEALTKAIEEAIKLIP